MLAHSNIFPIQNGPTPLSIKRAQYIFKKHTTSMGSTYADMRKDPDVQTLSEEIFQD